MIEWQNTAQSLLITFAAICLPPIIARILRRFDIAQKQHCKLCKLYKLQLYTVYEISIPPLPEIFVKHSIIKIIKFNKRPETKANRSLRGEKA